MFMNFLDKIGIKNIQIHGFAFFNLFFVKKKIQKSMLQLLFIIMQIEQLFRMLELVLELHQNNFIISHKLLKEEKDNL